MPKASGSGEDSPRVSTSAAAGTGGAPVAGPSKAAGKEGKPTRIGRSSAACTECHKSKQRCGGTSRIPCPRCALHGLNCVFLDNNGDPLPAATLELLAATSNNGNPIIMRGPQVSDELLAEVQSTSKRMANVEACLARLEAAITRGSVATTAIPNSTSPYDAQETPSIEHFRSEAQANPLDVVERTIAAQALDSLGVSPVFNERVEWDQWTCDVVTRGFMTLPECQSEFDLFFLKVLPWTYLFSPTRDRDAAKMRLRSPALFHVIILVALYYRPQTPANLTLYRNVSSIVDSILAPQMLGAFTEDITTDLMRALLLLVQYKTVQYTSLNARGVRDPAQVEQASKISVRSSYLIRGIINRISAFINLPNTILSGFIAAYAKRHETPVPAQLLADLRLYYCILWADMHGSTQSGRAPLAVPPEAVEYARSFASLNDSPYDTRLAAMVELAGLAAPILSSGRSYQELITFNDGLDKWLREWSSVLATLPQDPLGYTAVLPYATFLSVVVNAVAFNRWKERKKADSASPPSFMPGDREVLERCVRSAESLVFGLSLESRSGQGKARTTRWPAKNVAGDIPRLTLDAEISATHFWANDSVTACIWPFPLILLAKLSNEGLLSPNLQLSPVPRHEILKRTDKLARLIELGADFLEKMAPNPNHPSLRQAHFLRRLLDAAIRGQHSAIQSRPPSPQFGASGSTHTPFPNAAPAFPDMPASFPLIDMLPHGVHAFAGDDFNFNFSSLFNTGEDNRGLDLGNGQSALDIDWASLGLFQQQ